MKRTFFLLILFCIIVLSGCNSSIATNKYIDTNKLDATIIVSSLNTRKEYIINKERCGQRFLPASTFKIPNTLIALEEAAIKDDSDIIKWDGKDKGLKEWNKDQTLKTAFPISCVWFYQELAKKVGLEKYSEHLTKMNYGNHKTGTSVDTFWLEGDIRISAKEQVEFLKSLYKEEFSYKKGYYKILKDIMVEEKTSEYILRGKTGWAQRTKPQVGWYIGYVETTNDTWFFACNLDISKDSDASYRKDLVIRYLKDLKIIK